MKLLLHAHTYSIITENFVVIEEGLQKKQMDVGIISARQTIFGATSDIKIPVILSLKYQIFHLIKTNWQYRNWHRR